MDQADKPDAPDHVDALVFLKLSVYHGRQDRGVEPFGLRVSHNLLSGPVLPVGFLFN